MHQLELSIFTNHLVDVVQNAVRGGVYAGYVEYNVDPLGLGRCKVRIPSLHGISLEDGVPGIDTSPIKDIEVLKTTFVEPENFYISTEGLEWAYPLCSSSGFDSGSFIVPLVGTRVWVFFDSGERNKPIYFGGSYSIPRFEKTFESKYLQGLDRRKLLFGGEPWTIGNMSEVPREGRDIFGGVPTSRVILRSPKGHAIWAQDRDKGEEFSMVDRAGHAICMEARFSEVSNVNNACRRKLGSARSTVVFDSSKLYNPNAVIGMYGLSGSRLTLSHMHTNFSLEASTDNAPSCCSKIEASYYKAQKAEVTLDHGKFVSVRIENMKKRESITKIGKKNIIEVPELIIKADTVRFQGLKTPRTKVFIMGDLIVAGAIIKASL